VKRENEKAKAVLEIRVLEVVGRYYRVARDEARQLLLDLIADAA
jgi:hypothetical protein